MKLNRVLIIEKTSADERRSGRARHATAAERRRSLRLVTRALDSRGIRFRRADRFAIPRVSGFDMVIAFGGDGTFLAAAHKAGEVPILGVNAAPDHSVGFFCAAKPATFDEVLETIISGRLKLRMAPLIEAALERKAAQEQPRDLGEYEFPAIPRQWAQATGSTEMQTWLDRFADDRAAGKRDEGAGIAG